MRAWQKFLVIPVVVFLLVSAAGAATVTNRVLKLDGKGSYVELPPDIFKNLTQATVEVWAKWAEFPAFSRVFEFGAGYHSISLFNHATNTDLRYNVYPRFAKFDPSAMNTATARGLLRSNEWIHLAALSGPGGMKLYANGRLVAKHTNTASFADIRAAQTNVLGRGLAGNPTDRDFRGELDELRVWDHQRTLEQIRENMFKRLSGQEEGLVALLNFDDGTASDSAPHARNGKLVGKARVGSTDLDLAPVVVIASVPPPAVVPATNFSAPPVTVASAPVVAPIPAPNSFAAWWIAGALVALVVLLAWLVFMLRRSGLGSAKLMPPPAMQALPAAGTAAPDEIKARALEELTTFAKESLVQGLYSQRAALLETHQKAQLELAELEARVVALRLPDRIQAYEKRIAELESQLETRGDELRELTHATLQLLRQKLDEEKQKDPREPRRFN